jgi:hypothetical protein
MSRFKNWRKPVSLSDDEYTCLLIMKDGENLIRMRDTRWFAPLGNLYERDLVKPIGNENFVITQKGIHALVEHDKGLDAGLRQMINAQGAVNANRTTIHEKMHVAIDALSAAADLASKTTGESKRDALRNIVHEVLERALEKIA